jgi:branched-chain amino acid aminotransferase
MNVFFRIDDTLITAPTSDRILDGVTRKSVIALAERNGIKAEVRKITIDELLKASDEGKLMEIFGAGTAAVISPVTTFSYKDQVRELPQLDDSFAMRFKNELMDIQYNRAEDPFGWRYEVR